MGEQVDDRLKFLLTKSSSNTYKERIRMHTAQHLESLIQLDRKDDPDALDQLADMLDPKMSYSLLDMSRLTIENRRKTEEFTIMLN